jgi:hypothetical protein
VDGLQLGIAHQESIAIVHGQVRSLVSSPEVNRQWCPGQLAQPSRAVEMVAVVVGDGDGDNPALPLGGLRHPF